MPSWDQVVQDLQKREEAKQLEIDKANRIAPMDAIREEYIKKLSEIRGRNVICYYSGWLQRSGGNYPVSIEDNDMNGFMNVVCGLDRTKGLDLVLHTPGGDLAATEAIVNYLKSCFTDICAIVPQLAMSAGTMMACACNSIIMGRQSSLGPTDPQFGDLPAGGVVEEFEKAVEEIRRNPASAPMWAQIINKYPPTFLGDCQKAVDASKNIVKTWLLDGMLKGDDNSSETADRIVEKLCEHSKSAMHNRHFSFDELSELGLKVERLEDNNELQDTVLTIHHAFMNTFAGSQAMKIVENSDGKRWIVSVES